MGWLGSSFKKLKEASIHSHRGAHTHGKDLTPFGMVAEPWRNRFHNDFIGVHPFLGQVLRKKISRPFFTLPPGMKNILTIKNALPKEGKGENFWSAATMGRWHEPAAAGPYPHRRTVY